MTMLFPRCRCLSLALPLALFSLLACATEQQKPASVDEDIPRAGAAASGAEPDEPLSRQLLARARAREARRGKRAWRCAVEGACEPLSDDQRRVDRQDLELALEVLRQQGIQGAADRLAFRTAARLALEEAVVEHELARARLEDTLVLHAGPEMPYVYDDLPSALAQALPEARSTLLRSALPVVEARAALTPSAADAHADVAKRSRCSARGLVALRAGVDEAELRALASELLVSTAAHLPTLASGPADLPALLAHHQADLDPTSWRRGPLVAAFSGRRSGAAAAVPQCVVVEVPRDVRLIEGATAPPALARYARACASAAARLPDDSWDPAWLHVVAALFRDSAWLSPAAAARPEARERHRAAFVLEARRLSLEVHALLDEGASSQAALDALATSWTSPDAAPIAGASSLLALDPSGAAADALVAIVVAAAIDNAFTAKHGAAWAGHPESAAAVEEELDRLALVWHDAGPRGVLRALGLTEVNAAPVVLRAERLGR